MKRAVTATILGIFAATALAPGGLAGTREEYAECRNKFNMSDGWLPERLAICYLDAHELALYGQIPIDISDYVIKLIMTDERIRTIHVNSVGGMLNDARAIGRVMRLHGIDTHVYNTCQSACMDIFIAGRRRTASNGTLFGLHQPSDGAGKPLSASERKRMYKQAVIHWKPSGASLALLADGFNTPNKMMLYFSNQKARQANVINWRLEKRTSSVSDREQHRQRTQIQVGKKTGVNGHIPLSAWFRD